MTLSYKNLQTWLECVIATVTQIYFVRQLTITVHYKLGLNVIATVASANDTAT